MSANIRAIIVAICLVFIAPFAGADHERSRDRGKPVYIGFSLGFPGADTECDYHGYDCDGTDTGFRFYGGKRFHENLAFEVSLLDLGRLRDEEAALRTTAESEGVNLSLLGIIPVSGIGFFYGKAGYMLSDTRYRRIVGADITTSEDDSGDFTYGLGFGFEFGESYDFRIEFERLNDLNDDFVAGGSSVTALFFGGSIYFD